MKKQINVTPEQMTVICNIQMMQEKTGLKEDPFNWLAGKSYDELFDYQSEVMQYYNLAMKQK